MATRKDRTLLVEDAKGDSPVRKVNILLVDDDKLILKTLSSCLKIKGYAVTTARNKDIALLKLRQNSYDIVITDLVLEGTGGIRLLEETKKIDPDIPVIILTGYAGMTSAIDALRAGADDYLLKPCDIDELLLRISSCLEKQNFRKEIKNYSAKLEKSNKKLKAEITKRTQVEEELVKHRHHLQETVKKRTAELSKANEQLIKEASEHKQANEALHDSEARFRAITEKAGLGIALVKTNGRLIEYNPALQKFLGYSKKEMRNMHLADYTHPDDVEKDDKLYHKLREGKLDHYQIEKRYIRKDGQIVWGNLIVSLVRAAEGNPQYSVAMVGNITQRKGAEEELNKDKDYLEKLHNSIGEAIFTVKMPERVIEYVNNSVENIFGYKPDECIGKQTEIFYPNKEGYNEFADKVKKTLEERSDTLHVEQLLKKKNGDIFPSEITTSFLKENEKITRVISIVRDITERKRAEEELAKHRQHLEELVEERTEQLAKTNKNLKQEINKRKKIEETLRLIVEGTAGVTGEDFFRALVKQLATVLGVRYALVGRIITPEENRVKTLAVWAGGDFADNFEYDLAGTPCANVAENKFCFYPKNIQQKFPQDHLLVEMGVESYMGSPLIDSTGKVIGILVTLQDKPMDNLSFFQPIMEIIATRTIAEIERKRAEEALVESERELRIRNRIAEIFLTLPDKNMYVEVLQVILYALESKYGYFGYVDQDGTVVCPSITNNILEECRVPGEECKFPRNMWEGFCGKSLKEKNTFCFNGPFRLPQGHLPITRVMSVPIIYFNEVIGVIGIGNKPTDYNEKDQALLETIAVHIAPVLYARLERDRQEKERQQAEEALRIERDNLTKIFSSMEDGVYIVNQQNDIEYINPIIEKEFGPIEGRKCFEYFHDRNEVCTWCKNEDVLAGKTVHWEWFSAKNQKTYDLIDTPLKNLDGSIFKLEIFRDITERKQAEKELRRAYQTMRDILNKAPFGIILVNSEGNVEYVNPEMMEISGDSYEQFKNFNVLELPTYKKLGISQKIKDGLNGEYFKREGIEYTSYYGNKTTIRNFIGIPLKEEGKKKLLMIVEDITEAKQVEKALKVAKEVAENASAAKSQFLSNMSHELRTPLNSVLGFAQLLESDSDEPLSESQMVSTKQILKSGRHLLDLIKDVLDLSRIESGRLEISVENVAIGPLMEEVLTLISPMAEERDIILKNEICDCDCSLIALADTTRLKQALLNLVSNAVKYNKLGGSVILSCCDTSDGYLRLCVTDTGPGIPEEKIPDLFEPFQRLGAEATEVDGTGIGLTIAKRLVELMGGVIGVDSTPDGGSSFYIELGKAEGPTLEKAESPVSKPAAISPTEEGKKTLLYIEDNPASQNLIKSTLKRRPNITLFCAPQAQLGIELACAHRPDVILLDINLPDMNGFEVLKRLQVSKETNNIPVIALSANAMPIEIQKGLTAGFIRYLTKPIDIPAFLEVIDSVLGA